MGYSTDFNGQVEVEPPLSAEEVAYINKFAETRRMNRKSGPYFVEGTGDFGQGHDDDVIDHNSPDPSQPGLWCQWIATPDGKFIEWDGNEKFYNAGEWMEYIIDHFIGENPKAQKDLPFLTGHKCDGEIFADGEESGDHWKIVVTPAGVNEKIGKVVYE